MTDSGDNDTSVQSKVERDKTVATKEGGPERTSGGEIPMIRLTGLSLLYAHQSGEPWANMTYTQNN